jgi:hypothetical protein
MSPFSSIAISVRGTRNPQQSQPQLEQHLQTTPLVTPVIFTLAFNPSGSVINHQS